MLLPVTGLEWSKKRETWMTTSWCRLDAMKNGECLCVPVSSQWNVFILLYAHVFEVSTRFTVQPFIVSFMWRIEICANFRVETGPYKWSSNYSSRISNYKANEASTQTQHNRTLFAPTKIDDYEHNVNDEMPGLWASTHHLQCTSKVSFFSCWDGIVALHRHAIVSLNSLEWRCFRRFSSDSIRL